MKNQILQHAEVEHKIRRIAYQIYEANVNEKVLVIAGITGGGQLFAKKLQYLLAEITDAEILACEVLINKETPLAAPITISLSAEQIKGKSVVLVDDVLNSGTTLIYGVLHFLQIPVKQLKTAVMVNRNHKKYPVKADFKGISLSTSLQEHVQVDLKGKKFGVYLE
jgi:pyrimidine operon attenuation protein/uracil phosphoribosyltransferase